MMKYSPNIRAIFFYLTKHKFNYRLNLIQKERKMSKFVDLTGKKFGRWEVIEYVGRVKNNRPTWKCRCECGIVREVVAGSLINEISKSCGCLHKEIVSEIGKVAGKIPHIKHGHSRRGKKTKEFRAWVNIKVRCYNKNAIKHKIYKENGIQVCQRWLDSFENFLEDMGRAPSSKHSIDRIDNNGDYCKENCRWATDIEQAQNTRKNVWIELEGQRKIKADWEKELGVTGSFISYRLKKNIPFPEIVRQAREYKAVRHWGEDIRQDDFENGYGEII